MSPEFRAHYEQLGLSHRRSEGDDELCMGNVLEILCDQGVAAAMLARARFGVDAPLLAQHLVRMDEYSRSRPSILNAEVRMPQRVVAWISGDDHRYADDSPCLVEWPTERVEDVVADTGTLKRLLWLVDHHQEFCEKRLELEMAQSISYGAALTVLEYGPPGTGKTLLARALANHRGRPLVSLTPGRSDLATDFSLEYLFREARLQEGLVFIDECESLCSADSDDLPVLLRELERFEGIVIMATNRPQDLVPQLDRRFTVKVPFELPGAEARRRIWELHLGRTPLAPDVDLDRLARDYPIAGGYIKNAAQTAVNEALARGGSLLLSHGNLEVACRLQEQHVGDGLDRARRYRPRVRLYDLDVGADLREGLTVLAAGLQMQGEVWRALTGGEEEQAMRARVLFHGKDFASTVAAAEAVAAQSDRRIVRFGLGDLLGRSSRSREDWVPGQAVEAALRTGQVVMVTDGPGALAGGKKEEAEELIEILTGHTGLAGIVFVVSGVRMGPRHWWERVFHKVVEVTAGDDAAREQHWKRLLGSRAERIDVTALARAFETTPSQARMALERAALVAAGKGTLEVTQEGLWTALQEVVGEGRGEGLFG